MPKKKKVGDVEFINVDIKDPSDLQLLKSMTNNTPIRFKYNGEMAMGVVVPRSKPNPTEFLKNIKDYNLDSVDDANIDKVIELCRKMVVWEGVVGTILDLLIELSVTPIKVTNLKSATAKKIAKHMTQNLNIGNNNVTQGLNAHNKLTAAEYFVSGNVFNYEKWSRVRISGSKSEVFKLPMSIVPIDPTIIDIPKESVVFGKKVFRLDLKKLRGVGYGSYSRNNDNEFLKLLPLRVRKAIEDNKDFLEIKDDEIYHIKRRGSSYSGWGVPYLSRAISSIASKKRLRALDDGTIEGMIHSITILKVGDPNNEATWNPARLRALESLISSPSPSLTLIWSYDIDILHVGPSGDVLNFSDKYAQVNHDIITALGVPLSILTGQGERAGDMWISVLLLIERLKEYRDEFKIYWEHILKKAFVANNLPEEEPTVSFTRQTIRPEDIKNAVMIMYDRGLLSKEATLEELGYDIEGMAKQLKDEAQKYQDLFVPPALPFTSKTTDKEPDKDDTEPEEDKTTINDKTKKTIIDKTKARVKEVVQNRFNEYLDITIPKKINDPNQMFKINSDLKDKMGNIYDMLVANNVIGGDIDFKDQIIGNIDSSFSSWIQFIRTSKNRGYIDSRRIYDLVEGSISQLGL